MNNLLSKIQVSSLRLGYSADGISRLFYSTLRQPFSADSLLHRLRSGFESDRQGSVLPVLDKWVVEGRTIHDDELREIVREFKRRSRFRCALEIIEWMSGTKHFETKPGYISLKLDLTYKVHGLEEAESYFHSLDDSLKVMSVYGTLLYCYADVKSLEKAEAIMEKIRKLKLLSTRNCNVMLQLYHQMSMHEKLNSLTQEMEDNGHAYDEFSYNILLNAYSTSSDFEKMEKLLMKMEVDPLVKVNYHTYAAAARGYLNAGDSRKALESMRKAEHLVATGKEKRQGYVFLLTVYSSMQKTDEVLRLWKLLKKIEPLRNMDYFKMINSLLQLESLDEAKKLLREWEEQYISFDSRIPNLVITSLCRRGQMTEAEAIIKRVVETGNEPTASMWSRVALGYCQSNLMEKAVEMTKLSIDPRIPRGKPDFRVVAACLEYLKSKGDVKGAQEMLRLLESSGRFSADCKETLQRYIDGGKPKSETDELET